MSNRPFCDALNKIYKEYQEGFANISNLPQIGSDYYCPLAAGHYYLKNRILAAEKVNQMLLKSGLWKYELILAKNGTVVSVVDVFTTVTSDIDEDDEED